MPGWCSLPTPGPYPPTAGESLDGPILVQQVAAATTTATPTSISFSINPTVAGSTLLYVVVVAGAGSLPSFGNPNNTFLSIPNAFDFTNDFLLVYGVWYLQGIDNPGNISSITHNITGTTGIAAWVSEWKGNWFPLPYGGPGSNANWLSGVPVTGNQDSSESVTNPIGLSFTPVVGPIMLWGAEFDSGGGTYTDHSIGGTWSFGSQATSSGGANNVAIRPQYQVTTATSMNITYQQKGSLSNGPIHAGFTLGVLPLACTGTLAGNQPQSAPGIGQPIGGWGILGGTRPGGAGSGQ